MIIFWNYIIVVYFYLNLGMQEAGIYLLLALQRNLEGNIVKEI